MERVGYNSGKRKSITLTLREKETLNSSIHWYGIDQRVGSNRGEGRSSNGSGARAEVFYVWHKTFLFL